MIWICEMLAYCEGVNECESVEKSVHLPTGAEQSGF